VEGDFIPRIDVFDHTTGLVLPGAMPIIYQAWVTPSGGAPFQLTNPFGIALFPPNAMSSVFMLQHVSPPLGPVSGGIPGTQYYTYMESDLQAVNPRTLAVFEAGGLTEGNYTVEIRGFKWNGVNYVPQFGGSPIFSTPKMGHGMCLPASAQCSVAASPVCFWIVFTASVSGLPRRLPIGSERIGKRTFCSGPPCQQAQS
jgi:hypothetical protein